jgi:hypothetical protein
MLGSHSSFFSQSSFVLSKCRNKVSRLLDLKGYAYVEILVYLRAFDFFCKYPKEFDGATIVKDLVDIPGLDMDAMLHDYHYVQYNVKASFELKWKADWIYAKGNERKGKGSYSSYSRFVILSLINFLYVPFSRIRSGKISKAQRIQFLTDYDLLIKKQRRVN